MILLPIPRNLRVTGYVLLDPYPTFCSLRLCKTANILRHLYEMRTPQVRLRGHGNLSSSRICLIAQSRGSRNEIISIRRSVSMAQDSALSWPARSGLRHRVCLEMRGIREYEGRKLMKIVRGGAFFNVIRAECEISCILAFCYIHCRVGALVKRISILRIVRVNSNAHAAGP